ncbi:Hypothetical protein NTJ_03838 [Nesidiocoris tenuis]|uniref:Uncharacterized protein n=1 Tax=Nesidiocoris tenuis TaxID=355587 RepID=A0ABN7AFL3_9HEMI|nr:Hypothetical protein NTJ_03838 [Nesidiocoris tenuis]
MNLFQNSSRASRATCEGRSGGIGFTFSGGSRAGRGSRVHSRCCRAAGPRTARPPRRGGPRGLRLCKRRPRGLRVPYGRRQRRLSRSLAATGSRPDFIP